MSAPLSPLMALGSNLAVTSVFGGFLYAFLGRYRALTVLANMYASAFVGFGINAVLRPESALSFFEWTYPVEPNSRALIDHIMLVYGARDIFMGLALYAATLFGTRRTAGCILVAASACVAVDGYACKISNGGEWGHWGYGPYLAIIGVLLLL